MYHPDASGNGINYCYLLFPLLDDLFHSVIQCSLALGNCSNSQETNFSRKAKAWALTQLRHATTPILKNNSLLEIGEYCGYTAEESTEIMVEKVFGILNKMYLLFGNLRQRND